MVEESDTMSASAYMGEVERYNKIVCTCGRKLVLYTRVCRWVSACVQCALGSAVYDTCCAVTGIQVPKVKKGSPPL